VYFSRISPAVSQLAFDLLSVLFLCHIGLFTRGTRIPSWFNLEVRGDRMRRINKTISVGTLLIASMFYFGGVSAASALNWYFYGDHDKNALDSGAVLPAFDGVTNLLSTTSTYSDAEGNGKEVTVDGFKRPSAGNPFVASNINEHFRSGGQDMGHGMDGGTGTDELDSLNGLTEMLRYTLDTSLSNYTVFFSSVDGNEGVEIATSSSSSENGALTWFNLGGSGINSVGDGNGSLVEIVKPISLNDVFLGSENVKKYLFVREDPDTGGSNDDILVMQMAATLGAGGVVPEFTASIIWSLMGLSAVFIRPRRR
jgi:hypothetical protein